MSDEYTKDQDIIRSEETSKDDENKILSFYRRCLRNTMTNSIDILVER